MGYITSTGIFNDRCTNESGTVFLCALSRNPQTLDELVDKIAPSFADDNVSRDTIKKDAAEFFDTMVRNANESPTGNPLEINRHFCAVAAKNKQIVLDWRNEKLKAVSK
ncbi:MAG: PqqD family protein [Treponema sp.]|nr:PqqD family protein [Treponema sp.]